MRWLKWFIGFIVLAVAACAVLIWYVKPQRQLDLNATELQLAPKLMDMVKHRQTELTLTEPEVNQLLKGVLASRRQLTPDLTLTGADFQLADERLRAAVQVVYADWLQTEGQIVYRLVWQPPYLTAVPEEARVKGLSVPMEWLGLTPVQVNLEERLPQLVGIREVAIEGQELHIRFDIRLGEGR
ncbi:hypothetical protein [Paenibacillus sp. y28]|uniref:hypothetical protein n=1 Tax=Paenibacillus sp. y28 TaxID=3129110 RepID=UPI00301AB43B